MPEGLEVNLMYGRRISWRGNPAPAGYRYLGPCRCGMGPHAFFMDPTGRITHASRLPRVPSIWTNLEAELEALREEKAWIEKRIQELERLKAQETEK